jgi:alkanesulfonate monooxygenase SsuD/methylene tetrahydromethanopterin reductase-like flavin-dependent oxidoreductase (luciferase family)
MCLVYQTIRRSCIEVHAVVIPPLQPRELRDIAVEAEQLGYDRFWVADQTFHVDPFVALADLATRVQMPLGLAVTNPYARHPVQIARSIASICHLHPRENWVFALGAANPQHVLRPLGFSLQRPAQSLTRALEAVRALLKGEVVSVNEPGVGFSIEEVSLEMDPCNPALYIGTRGPLVLRGAGAVADGVIVESQSSEEGIAWARGHLDRGSQSAGRGQWDRPYVAWQVTEVADGGQFSAEAREFGVMLMRSSAEQTLRAMSVAEDVVRMVKQEDVSSRDVPTREVAKFIAADTADHLKARVQNAARCGCTAWAAVFTGDSVSAVSMMRRFGKEVLAHCRIEARLHQGQEQ